MMSEYFDKYRDPRWQKKKNGILERDKYKCQHCGAEHKTLEVHHLAYGGEPWDIEDDLLLTLCSECHSGAEHLIKAIRRLTKDIDASLILANVVCFLEKNPNTWKAGLGVAQALFHRGFAEVLKSILQYVTWRNDDGFSLGWDMGKKHRDEEIKKSKAAKKRRREEAAEIPQEKP